MPQCTPSQHNNKREDEGKKESLVDVHESILIFLPI
jgi:hypothetical protein